MASILIGSIYVDELALGASGSGLILEEEGSAGMFALDARVRGSASTLLPVLDTPPGVFPDAFRERSVGQYLNPNGKVYTTADDALHISVRDGGRISRIDILRPPYFTQRLVQVGQSSLEDVFREYGNPGRVCAIGDQVLAFAYDNVIGGGKQQILFGSERGLGFAREGKPSKQILETEVSRIILRNRVGADLLFEDGMKAFLNKNLAPAFSLIEWSLCESAPPRGRMIILYGTLRVAYAPHAVLAELLVREGRCADALREIKASRKEDENLENLKGLGVDLGRIESRCGQGG